MPATRRCPHEPCGHRNRPEARYCARCGSALARGAPAAAGAGVANGRPATAVDCGNPIVSVGWFVLATLMLLAGALLVFTGGPFVLGLILIGLSCTTLSTREEG